MNEQATTHLAKAKDYVAKGEQFYRKAAEEIVAAQEVGATQREVAEAIGRGRTWVTTLLSWARDASRTGTPFAQPEGELERRHASAARKVLRETPEIVSQLSPDEQRRIATELDNASAKRQKDREQVAKTKERDALGDETVDDLELREELQSAEYLLITARGNLRGFVKRTGEIGIENAPDAWRESCLDWIGDLQGHLGMAKALLAGDNIDWSAFDELLEKETS
jgi:hypothetical protein